ncbi:hypothetical protein [Sphingopyxis sp. H050]|uniref:hypothetical protein n=1 Tax=Sphingopyxis sp. H050 TaxID=1759072 RepID=UPI0012E3F735|nr:hypothetical protein [Sphingopyxis sp. H050]
MSSAKVERDAKVALVAFYRTWVTEGLGKLSTSELAERTGYKAPKQISTEALDLLVSKQWIACSSDAVELTDAGRNAAVDFLDQRQK